MLDEINELQKQLQEELQLISYMEKELNINLPEPGDSDINTLMQGGRRKQITKRKKVKRTHNR